MAKKEREENTEKLKRFRISSPVSSFKGVRAGVKFTEGVGFTTDEQLVSWFEGLGYTVTEDAVF